MKLPFTMNLDRTDSLFYQWLQGLSLTSMADRSPGCPMVVHPKSCIYLRRNHGTEIRDYR